MENLFWLLVLLLFSLFAPPPRAEANGAQGRALPVAQSCQTNLDCSFGFECFLNVCVESQCHAAHGGSHAVVAHGCTRGTICIYEDGLSERHGNGFCDTP